MYLVDGTVVTSASDLKKASECEFAFLRALDAKLGRIEPVPDPEDAMLERSGRLGDEHEHRVLEATAPTRRRRRRDRAARRARCRRGGRRRRRDEGGVRGRCPGGLPGHVRRRGLHRLRRLHRAPARRPLPRAGHQARPSGTRHRAAAARGLRRTARAHRRAVRRHRRAAARRRHDERAPPRRHRARLPAAARSGSSRSSPSGSAEGGPGRVGRPALRARRALRHVRPRGAGAPRRAARRRAARSPSAAALLEAGITTIDALAASAGPVPGILDATIANLRIQARLQLEAEARGGSGRDGAGLRSPDDPPLPPPVVVRDAASLAAIPEPDRGDLFFDFEGDPLYTEGAATDWGLDYLFGMVDTDEQFTPLWAHSFAEERRGARALPRPRRRCGGRRTRTCTSTTTRPTSARTCSRSPPGTASARPRSTSCSPTACSSTSTRSCGARCGSGSRSYSIKKLEPLYMGDELREAR